MAQSSSKREDVAQHSVHVATRLDASRMSVTWPSGSVL